MCTSGFVNTKEASLLAEIYPRDVIGIEVMTGGSRKVYEPHGPLCRCRMVELVLFQLGSFLD